MSEEVINIQKKQMAIICLYIDEAEFVVCLYTYNFLASWIQRKKKSTLSMKGKWLLIQLESVVQVIDILYFFISL